jgi:hypothetical protein
VFSELLQNQISHWAIDDEQDTEKSLLQAAQKDPEARRAKNRRAKAYSQYVAARRLSGNEAYGSFSATC